MMCYIATTPEGDSLIHTISRTEDECINKLLKDFQNINNKTWKIAKNLGYEINEIEDLV